MLRVHSPVTSLDRLLADEPPSLELKSARRLGRPRRAADTEALELDALRSQVDTEMNLALSLGTPLALGGASLLAHGVTVPSRTCSALGVLAIAGVTILLVRTRSRVRKAIIRDAELRGMSLAEGKLLAKEYLSSW